MSSPDDIGIQTYIEALEAGRQEIVRLREQLSGRTMSCSQCDATAAEIVRLRAEVDRYEEIRLRDDAVIRRLQATNLSRYKETDDD